MDGTVIIADDDKALRTVLTTALTRAGAKVRATATLATLWRWLEEGEGDVVLCDVNLADGDGLDALPNMKKLRPELDFLMMSAQNTVVTALRAQEAGAYDYLAKPFDLREMVQRLNKALNARPTPKTDSHYQEDLPLIGRSEAMQQVYRQIAKITASDLPVLIMGELGTGKSLVANVVHDFGGHKNQALIRYDGLAGDAERIDKLIEEAGQGTFLIENADELLPTEQRKLAAALAQDGIACRVLTTSKSDLGAMADEGRFRADLFHRLSALQLQLPNLSDRSEDIAELADHFLAGTSAQPKRLSKGALALLQSSNWRGNLTELRNVLKRASVMAIGDELDVPDLKAAESRLGRSAELSASSENFGQMVEAYVRRFLKLHGQALPPTGIYEPLLAEFDRPLIKIALEATAGNQLRAAELLGINRNTLRKKIKTLDISISKGKKLM